MPTRPAIPRACAAVAALLAAGGCGEQRRPADTARDRFAVAIERAEFPARQRLARRAALVLAIRNAGAEPIPALLVRVRGLGERFGDARGGAREPWIVDRGPAAARTAFDDVWRTGRLEPGRAVVLRWTVTPAIAGAHALAYAVSPAPGGDGAAGPPAGGAARGLLRARVAERPATARVDARTGAVVRSE